MKKLYNLGAWVAIPEDIISHDIANLKEGPNTL